MLSATCPTCNNPVPVDEALVGSIVACPSCGQQIRLRTSAVAAPPAPLETTVQTTETGAAPALLTQTGMVEDAEEETPAAEPQLCEVATAEPRPRPTLPHFATTPYRPDRGLTVSGSVRLIAQLVIAAGVLGFVASFVGQWLYLLLVFPVLIGLALGAVGRVGIRSGKVRNPWLAGGAGFLAGVLAMTTMHYFDYLRFDREFPPAQRAALRAVLGQLQAKMGARQPGLRNLPRNPAVFQAIKVHDFPSYVDYTAHIGVTISHGGGRNGGMNLGYVGSYIYWLVEMFIVAGIAFSIMRVQASEPFCTTCRNWKQKRSIGTLSLPASPVVEAVRDGNVNALWDHDPRSYGGPLAVFVSSCQQCGNEAAADVLVQHVTTDKKGQVKRRNLVHVSYPGEAAQAFEVLFQK